MGIIAQGILGAISGKVGNVVGASWRGIPYLRIKPASVANPRTVGQVNQRNKFAATAAFVKAMKAFIEVGYKFHQNKMTASNAASAYILRNAITGIAPDFEVDYANALVSRGSLPGAGGLTSELAGGSLTVTWANNSGTGQAQDSDQLLMAVYSPAQREAEIVTGLTRFDMQAVVSLPEHFTGPMEVFLAFQSADGRAVSDSAHLQAVEA